MFTKEKGFTLIELLVVVLIIGILVAIAVPQYQKAVLKARVHRAVPLVESLYQAQQAYALIHGKFATNDIGALDISFPECKKSTDGRRFSCSFGSIGLSERKDAISYSDKYSDSSVAIIYLRFIKDFPVPAMNMTFEKDKRYCWAKPDNKIANYVCINMGGKNPRTNQKIWTYYTLD